ncbi:MAG TPA: outer membrane lipoprotein carrier protein LolA [Fibrobacteraceae bacterium]|nr:outer membrane lipoprotein carrier protein LolA [Fibrobacteraceae bacterium]
MIRKWMLLATLWFPFRLLAVDSLYIPENKITEEIPYSLEELFSSIHKTPAFIARYHQIRTLPNLRKPLESSGEFAYDAHVGVEIRQQTPVHSTTRIQANQITLTDANGASQEISTNSSPQIQGWAQMISWIFSGNIEPLRQQFSLWYDAGEGHQIVGLEPNSLITRQYVQRITLDFSRKGLVRMELQESSHSYTVWLFSQHTRVPAGLAIPQ